MERISTGRVGFGASEWFMSTYGSNEQGFITLGAPLFQVDTITNQDGNYGTSTDVQSGALSQALC